jgi:hypothetical protein
LSIGPDGIAQPGLEALPLQVAEGYYSFLIPLDELPVPRQQRPHLRGGLERCLSTLHNQLACESSVFLQLDELHRDNAVRNISQYAQQWKPQIGLGVRPEAPPPRYWTEDDLLERDYTSPIPMLMHTVIYLDADQKNRDLAREVMTGSGGLIQVLHRSSAAQLVSTWYNSFQPTIQEEGLAAYPLYAPLIGAASVANRPAEDISRWLGDASVYVRESIEDKGVFLLSRFPLEMALEQAGFRESTRS